MTAGHIIPTYYFQGKYRQAKSRLAMPTKRPIIHLTISLLHELRIHYTNISFSRKIQTPAKSRLAMPPKRPIIYRTISVLHDRNISNENIVPQRKKNNTFF